MKLDPAQRAEARQIATELARLARSADVLPGTITERHTRCGKPSCACHHDPPRLHGPYWHWTRKDRQQNRRQIPQQRPSRRLPNAGSTTTAASANSSPDSKQIGIDRLAADQPRT